ncbi:MAG TPA: tetratricopeptide repeat protein [Syntrophales bacterium]|nr:tetratricopeptide repeat protein [Syntrophales bacterium]
MSDNSLPGIHIFTGCEPRKIDDRGGNPRWEDLNSEELQILVEDYLVAGHCGEAIEILRRLVARHPGEDSFVLKLAWAYHDGGFLDEAVACFEALLEKELQRRIFTGFAFDELVRIYKREGRYDNLVAICERAMAAQPEDYALMGDLGDAYLKTGDVAKAVAVFRRMTELEPEDAMACCRLGNALAAGEEFDAAEAAYRRAGEIEPLSAAAYYGRLAVVYRDAGHIEAAVRMAALCIREDAAEPAHHLLAGELLLARGDIEAAVAAYETAMALRPEFTAAYCNRLGNALALANHHEKAVAAFQKAVTAEPQNPFYLLYLADAQRALEEKDNARADSST